MVLHGTALECLYKDQGHARVGHSQYNVRETQPGGASVDEKGTF